MTLGESEVETILTSGDLELSGRLVTASNASFLGAATLDGVSVRCIYKPVHGERPLWDFPTGSLANRERAARIVSAAGGWDVVPPTVLRDGRFGRGMCQRWIEVAGADLIDIVSAAAGGRELNGWIAVLEAEDQRSRPVLLVHRDDERLRDMAVFDVVVNNADRKGGHVLVDDHGAIFGCDHGVCFHVDNKLRTVLWGWADDPLRDTDVFHIEKLLFALSDGLDDELATLLTDVEVAALHGRVEALRDEGRMPVPHGSWPAIPWPAF